MDILKSTPLVGRALALKEVGDLLHTEQVRLVTLTGPGGVGKTKLAIYLSDLLGTTFRDGVILVGLTHTNS